MSAAALGGATPAVGEKVVSRPSSSQRTRKRRGCYCKYLLDHPAPPGLVGLVGLEEDRV